MSCSRRRGSVRPWHLCWLLALACCLGRSELASTPVATGDRDAPTDIDQTDGPGLSWHGYSWLNMGSATWTGDADTLSVSECSSASAVEMIATTETWADLEVAVSVRIDATCGGTQIGSYLRTDLSDCDHLHAYGCLIDWDNKLLRLCKWDNVCLTYNCRGPSMTAVPTGVWYSLIAHASGTIISCELSGGGLATPLTATVTDAAPLPAGHVRLGIGAGSGSFRALQITPQ